MSSMGQFLQAIGWDKFLDDLAERVGRNVMSHRDPEAFHQEKSEIRESLKRLSRGEDP